MRSTIVGWVWVFFMASTALAADPVHTLCDALQALPDARKAQCCSTQPARGLAAACVQELQQSMKARAVALDPAEVGRCAETAARELDGCDWVTPYQPRLPASCRNVVHGTLAAGATCRSSLECRDGLFCHGSGPTVAGICAPPAPPGAVCGAVPDNLTTWTRQLGGDPLHRECDGFCLRGRCTRAVSLGGDCAADEQCAAGSHCAAKRCVEGAPPTLGEACAGATCAGALVCVDGRCAEPKKAGESCTQLFECRGSCLARTNDTPGTCGMRCSAWPPAGYTPPVADAQARATHPNATAVP